jgi:hypothetical protein
MPQSLEGSLNGAARSGGLIGGCETGPEEQAPHKGTGAKVLTKEVY